MPTMPTLNTWPRLSDSYILALHSLPRAGKDSIAKVLGTGCNQFQRFAFADRIYDELADVFMVESFHLRSDEWKMQPQPDLALGYCKDFVYRTFMLCAGHDHREPRTTRFHARAWAHEYRRVYLGQKTYWIDHVVEQIRSLSSTTNVVITDLRYQDDEYPALVRLAEATKRTLVVVEVIRTDQPPVDIHKPSDTRLRDECIDLQVINKPGALFQAVDHILKFLHTMERRAK